MTESPNHTTKVFDLEERTYSFARNVVHFTKKLPRNVSNVEYVRQVVRSSSSVGANYIEANESLGKKDFAMRIKICRKEAKESAYWLALLKDTNGEECKGEVTELRNEAVELKKIFSAILVKTK